jgi:hypothetical protein
MDKASLRLILESLKNLIAKLAQDEMPPPLPPSPVEATQPLIRTVNGGERLEGRGPDGQWHEGSFVPRGYEYDESDGGFWRRYPLFEDADPRISRYFQERMGDPRR